MSIATNKVNKINISADMFDISTPVIHKQNHIDSFNLKSFGSRSKILKYNYQHSLKKKGQNNCTIKHHIVERKKQKTVPKENKSGFKNYHTNKKFSLLSNPKESFHLRGSFDKKRVFFNETTRQNDNKSKYETRENQEDYDASFHSNILSNIQTLYTKQVNPYTKKPYIHTRFQKQDDQQKKLKSKQIKASNIINSYKVNTIQLGKPTDKFYKNYQRKCLAFEVRLDLDNQQNNRTIKNIMREQSQKEVKHRRIKSSMNYFSRERNSKKKAEDILETPSPWENGKIQKVDSYFFNEQ